jgi:phage-related minor tail protein
VPDGNVSLLFKLLGDSDDAEKAFDNVDKKSEDTGEALKKFGAAAGVAGAAGAATLAVGFAQNLDIGAANAKLAAQLDLSEADAAKAGDVAGAVYADNWGGSIEEVNDAVRRVGINLASVSSSSAEDLEMMTSSALAFSQTFDQDVALATEAAGALLKNGLAKDAEEAFDILTRGEQLGIDKADDMLSVFQEYSPQFSKLGIDGAQALSVLQAGLKGGARDADYVADALKEFQLIAVGGGTAASDAWKALGLNAKTTGEDFAAGGDRARNATFSVMQALADVTDEQKRNELGLQLFGTKWEDTMYTVLPSVAMAEERMEGVEGATQRMAETAGGSAKGQIEGLQRGFEQWAQGMAESTGMMGLLVTGVGAFGGEAVGMAGSLGSLVAGLGAMNAGSIVARGGQLAWSAAVGVATAAQWLWNAAMVFATSPLGLLVIAIAAVVAGLVWFVTQTETGRAVFQGAMHGMSVGLGWVWDKATGLFSWVRSNWPLLLAILTGPIGLAVLAITKNWDKIKTGLASVGSWIKSHALLIFSPFAAGARSAFNSIARFWNGTVGGFTFSIPSWIPGIGGNSWSIPSLPYLAEGGILLGPTLMVGGEAGPEAVVPLDRAEDYGLGGGGTTILEVHLHGVLAGDQQSFAESVITAIQTGVRRGALPRTLLPS